jgi:uncharacterized protein YraI
MAAVAGFAVSDVNLHSGPGSVYPVVDTLPAGARLRIDGCIGRYAWCNVSWNGVWGWVPADDLQALYRGRRVLVLDYGPEIGLPIIGFSVDSYWGEHYRGRGFYARIHDFDRGRYAHGAVGVNGRVGANGRTGVNGRTNATIGAGGRNERGGNATVGAGVRNENGGRNGAAIRNEGPRSGAMNQRPLNAPAANVNAAPAHPRETTGAAPRAEFGGRNGGGGGGGQAPTMPAGGSGGAPHAAGGGGGHGGGGGGGGHGGGGGDHRH